jgi:hypothetical protein
VQNVNKGLSRRRWNSTHEESVATVLRAYTQSPGKSVSQRSRETGKNPIALLKS